MRCRGDVWQMHETAVHDDWDQHWLGIADCTSRNPAPAMRRRLVRALLGIGRGPARILDIGCGQGDMLADLRRHHPQAEVCGTDFSRYGIEVARGKVASARFFQRDLTAPGDPEPEWVRWATHAVCSEVLEHVDDPVGLLVNARGYLARGCRLVVTVPGGPMSRLDSHIGHRRHYTPDRSRVPVLQPLPGAGGAARRSHRLRCGRRRHGRSFAAGADRHGRVHAAARDADAEQPAGLAGGGRRQGARDRVARGSGQRPPRPGAGLAVNLAAGQPGPWRARRPAGWPRRVSRWPAAASRGAHARRPSP
ncbi:MAG: class I SAM-dependent methyltransferase [Chloroflexi bacterium]|nr:MAG: class I SAM-dependent methyltransferase [Chloroflexota bacterium]